MQPDPTGGSATDPPEPPDAPSPSWEPVDPRPANPYATPAPPPPDVSAAPSQPVNPYASPGPTPSPGYPLPGYPAQGYPAQGYPMQGRWVWVQPPSPPPPIDRSLIRPRKRWYGVAAGIATAGGLAAVVLLVFAFTAFDRADGGQEYLPFGNDEAFTLPMEPGYDYHVLVRFDETDPEPRVRCDVDTGVHIRPPRSETTMSWSDGTIAERAWTLTADVAGEYVMSCGTVGAYDGEEFAIEARADPREGALRGEGMALALGSLGAAIVGAAIGGGIAIAVGLRRSSSATRLRGR